MHIFHKWSKWFVYEEKGSQILLSSLSHRSGEIVNYCETRQFRKCLICGRTQDELIKPGPAATASLSIGSATNQRGAE